MFGKNKFGKVKFGKTWLFGSPTEKNKVTPNLRMREIKQDAPRIKRVRL
jgi:hypothetical protein